MHPAGKALGSGEISARHQGFFNCNPNLTPIVVGGIVRLEEQKLAGRPVSEEDIEHFKKSMGPPLAAIGDLFFLAGLKPLALTLACVFAIYKSVSGLLAVFLLYNLLIVGCRFWGLRFGYRKGWELVEVFSSSAFQRALDLIQTAAALCGGVLAAVLLFRYLSDRSWGSLAAGLLIVSAVALLRRDISASWYAVFLFLLSVLFSTLVG